MELLSIVSLAVIGLCLGSFVNAFVWRHYEQEQLLEKRRELASSKGAAAAKKIQALKERHAKLSIARGRSMCTHCGHVLSWRDLVPVISYLGLRGKCRYCGKKIQDSPLAELLTPVLFVMSYLFWPEDLQGIQLLAFGAWLLFVVGFVALAMYDRRWFLLPHSIVLPLICLALVRVVLLAFFGDQGVSVVWQALLGAFLIGGLFYFLYVVSHEKWIGGGDVTLGVLLGLLVGGPGNALLLIFLASLLGTLVAIPMLAAGKAGRNTRLPFGPFLMLAAVIVTLFGHDIITWYTQRFLLV